MKGTISHEFMQHGRIICLVLIAWPSISLAGGISAGSPKVKAHPVISIRVINYAHVARAKLHEAERQAADLFAKAGVRIAWRDNPQEGRSVLASLDHSTADFSVRILYACVIERMRRPSEANALGESTVPSGTDEPTSGGFANVFYDRVKDVSARWGLFSGQVLGDAIAHELGHLLLGAGHSSQGIMKASWTSRDLDLASRGKLQFLPAQGTLLQRAALSLHQDSSPMVLAQR